MRPFPLAAVLLALLPSLGARAAPLVPGTPAFSLVLEGLYAQPGGGHVREAAGGSIGAALRLSDQLAAIGGVSLLGSRAGGISALSFGLQAILDVTPVIPFLDLAVVRLGPEGNAGYTLATRTGGGADWQLGRSFALGLAVHTLTPLDGTLIVAGTEIALRFVFKPGAVR